ncbi:acyltransferase family protein [Pseudoroseomonas globiformis]|uniref:Acyltransferase family protein n=1 Tax=Teichococcus globiformis TaxID=2307229 RepID=A0ABV7G287_9PROT
MSRRNSAPYSTKQGSSLLPHSDASRPERQHYLDYLRALLMFMGIPYHVALAYSTQQAWIVQSEERSALLSWAAQFSHTFRMPVFFLIAGLFALMLCQRNPGEWWRSRLVRLGVPLIAAALLINPLTMLSSALWQAQPGEVIQTWIGMLQTPGEPWVSHLWFLIDLLIYCTVLVVLWSMRDLAPARYVAVRGAEFLDRHVWAPPALLILSGFVSLASVVVLKLLDLNSAVHGMLVLSRTAAYLPVFLCGAALILRPDWLTRFTRVHKGMWVVGLTLAVVQAAIQWRDEDIYRIGTYFLMPIVGILFAHILMSAMRMLCNTASPMVQTAVASSFTVYLVHEVFVVYGVLMFLDTGVPVLMQFVILTVVTILLSMAFHQWLVRPSAVMRLLFNGIPIRRKSRAVEHAGAAPATPGR